MRASNKAYSRSDLQFFMVAGVGFEPTCDTRSHALSELVKEVRLMPET